MNSLEKVYVAGGCFWGVEHYMRQLLGVVSTSVGYMGGQLSNPTYQDVCSKTSGHAEVVEVVYDASVVQVEDVIKLFFEIHDPGQLNRQGPDRGDQYRSEIFYTTEAQEKTARALIDVLKDAGHEVVTLVSQAGDYWKAEGYHQSYYEKNGQERYCHRRTKKF